MAQRHREREARREEAAAAVWDVQSLAKTSRDGTTIIYPSHVEHVCPDCGMEIGLDVEMDHPFVPDPDGEEICLCGYHESYHRAHDCAKDLPYAYIPCACTGGGPDRQTCCLYRYARQKRFLRQRLANVLRAAIDSRS